MQDRRDSPDERFNNHNWVEVYDGSGWSFTGDQQPTGVLSIELVVGAVVAAGPFPVHSSTAACVVFVYSVAVMAVMAAAFRRAGHLCGVQWS